MMRAATTGSRAGGGRGKDACAASGHGHVVRLVILIVLALDAVPAGGATTAWGGLQGVAATVPPAVTPATLARTPPRHVAREAGAARPGGPPSVRSNNQTGQPLPLGAQSREQSSSHQPAPGGEFGPPALGAGRFVVPWGRLAHGCGVLSESESVRQGVFKRLWHPTS